MTGALKSMVLAICLPAASISAWASAAEERAWTPPDTLAGDWRVVRTGDPSDAALMRLQLSQEGRVIQGDYVLFQPFCGIDLPVAEAGAELCEFDGVAADATGVIRDGLVTIGFRPGADGLEHRLIFPAAPATGPFRGAYLAPGAEAAVPVTLARAPD